MKERSACLFCGKVVLYDHELSANLGPRRLSVPSAFRDQPSPEGWLAVAIGVAG